MIQRRVAAGFAAALLITVLSAPSAQAVPTDAPLADCAQGGGVYVVVTPADGSSTGACVTNPASGTAALEAAGVAITRDAKGMICALNNYPNPCPAAFDGKYWQYYQASAADAGAGTWNYATTGSDDTKPAAGSVEGWCYGETCLPKLPVASPPASTQPAGINSPVPVEPISAHPGFPYGWLIAGVIAVATAAVVGVILARRQPAGAHAEPAPMRVTAARHQEVDDQP